jgi:hypothetical protein
MDPRITGGCQPANHFSQKKPTTNKQQTRTCKKQHTGNSRTMKTTIQTPIRPVLRSGILKSCAILALATCSNFASAQVVPPADVKLTCTVSPSDFAKWYKTGTVTPNGVVNPADGIAFQANSLCAFYKWSEQMFLWFTSPGGYQGRGHVFDSSVFFDVSVEANGVRTLIPNSDTAISIRNFTVRIPQVGPKGLKVVHDAAGKPFLRLPFPNLPSGSPHPSGIIQPNEEELGQAGSGGALMTQGKSLVYYSISVNDVYAYFLTAQKTNALNPAPTKFPTTAADLAQIVAFATAHGKKIPDANALAIETKASWVDASTVDASKFITIDAVVPKYDTSNPQKWVANGTQKLKLALTGVHIVGTVVGHPEMIWATFEHQLNSPNAAYSYIKTNGTTGTVPQNTTGNWIFCKSGSTGVTVNGTPGHFNIERMTASGTTLNATPTPVGSGLPTAIAPSDTLRVNPWGSLTGPGSAQTNTDVLSLNSNILGMIPPNDVRRHYLLMGATWTVGGKIPGVDPGAQTIGSLHLANTTLETYTQSLNCFDCHQGPSFGPDNLTHIYALIKALTLP